MINLQKNPIARECVLLYSSTPETLARAGRVLEAAGFIPKVSGDLDDRESGQKRERTAAEHQKFLAALNDELRNSLSAISNAVALLKLTPSDSRSTQIAKEILERQTRHLIEVANALDATDDRGLADPEPREPHGSDPAKAPATAGPTRRLLVVDDNQDAARSLAMLLENQRYQVEIAHDGRTALDLAYRDHPQVLLLDLGLPELDGYQVAERLRADPQFNPMLLVAITGHSLNGEESRGRLKAVGFDYFLTKPVDFEQLRALLTAASSPSGPGATS
ncbi:MAG: response regulator [Candidatus Competibacteraceae bacterium]|nr:MAG: response regulator [Candidatus Competibacteraceae bacterium]